MITAIVLINAQPDLIPEVATSLTNIPGVREVYSVSGDVDLIAIVSVREHEDLAETIAGSVNKIAGVKRTATHIAFRTYSPADLESGFSIGAD